MGDSISAMYDNYAEYTWLCQRYGEKVLPVSGGWYKPLHELKKRHDKENAERTAEANRQNVLRYLAEATTSQLRSELIRRRKPRAKRTPK